MIAEVFSVFRRLLPSAVNHDVIDRKLARVELEAERLDRREDGSPGFALGGGTTGAGAWAGTLRPPIFFMPASSSMETSRVIS